MRVPEEKTHMKNPGVDGRIILRLNLKNYYWMAWIGFIWPTIVTSDGLLLTRE